MAAQSPLLLPVRHVPELYGFIAAAAGQCLAVRSKRQGLNRAAMARENEALFLPGQVPHADRPVRAARGGSLSIRRERHRTNLVLMPAQRGHDGTRARVP